MEPRRIIRTDIAASAIAHLTLVALIILISEVHPFHAPPTETVSVDIVTPEALKDRAREPAAPPTPQFPAPDASAMSKTEALNAPPPSLAQQPPPSPSPQSPPAQAQQSRPQQKSPPGPSRREANAQPQPQPQPQPPPPQPGFRPPEPDVTVKYGVLLGLPEALPPLPNDKEKNDGGDAKDSVSAKLPADVIAAFRRHLKSCAKLPASVAPSDNVHIKLRAVMTTDGRLARAPILIEASASAKGPILMQAANGALQACQPYTMLPADQYQEWKVLDLSFTPRDFNAS